MNVVPLLESFLKKAGSYGFQFIEKILFFCCSNVTTYISIFLFLLQLGFGRILTNLNFLELLLLLRILKSERWHKNVFYFLLILSFESSPRTFHKLWVFLCKLMCNRILRINWDFILKMQMCRHLMRWMFEILSIFSEIKFVKATKKTQINHFSHLFSFPFSTKNLRKHRIFHSTSKNCANNEFTLNKFRVINSAIFFLLLLSIKVYPNTFIVHEQNQRRKMKYWKFIE